MSDLAAQLEASQHHREQTAPGGPAHVADNSLAPETARRSRPVRLIISCGIFLIVAIAVGTGIMLSNLHSRALTDNEREIKNIALVLAKQMERDFDAVVSVQTSLIERIRALGIASSEDFEQRMSNYDTHLLLKDKVVGFNYLGAIILVNSQGKIFNFSRSWPIPDINAADRDYFMALQSDEKLNSVVSKPTLNRATGTWIVQIARKVSGPNGKFLGLVLGAIELQSVEQYFARVALGPDSSISLIHRDGELMARHPHAASVVGRPISGGLAVRLVSNSDSGVGRRIGAVGEAEDRLIAAHRVANYPFLVAATTNVAAVLADWWRTAYYLIGIAALAILVVAAGTFLVIRQFKNYASLERLRAEKLEAETLREQTRRLDAALSNMSQGLVMFDPAGRLVVCNDRYRQMYKLSPDLVKPGCMVLDLLKYRGKNGTFFGNPEKYVDNLLATITEGETEKHEAEIGDGRIIFVVNQPMAGGGWVATHEDVTEKVRAEKLNEQQKFQLDAALENMSQGLCMFDATQRLIVCNKRYAELYGLNAEQTEPGTTLRTILEYRVASGNAPDDHESYINDRINEVTENKPYQITNRLSDGRYIFVVHQPMADGGWVATHADVTDRKRAERRIAHMAHFDMLTDLPNRTTFNDAMDATLDRGRTRDEQFAVLSIDLDRFKEANDTYGHLVGDALLREVARRLQAAAEGAFVARIGGDEFVVILEDGAQPAAATALAERLLAALADDFEIEGHLLKLGLSIGAAVYPTDGTDAKTLIANADAALYRAKAETRGKAMFYEPEMGDRARERRALQEDLRLAIDRGELLLHYQPQMKMSGETIGFEALVRWQCPKRGIVSPGTFIPIAEESSLIISVGEWVLREACREAASWPQPLTIAVNISLIQFRQGDLPRLVHSILLETGLAPARLELEITESVMIHDFSRAVSILNRLKSLGVKIAMDDFGTGYSSLSYLQSFRCDKIKIDRIFICDLEHNHHSRAIVRAVIGLGQSLNLPILAEGVETEAQHTYLMNEGCDEVQGYLTGRPLPITDYADLVGRQSAAQQNYAVAG
jgi:diguanylate cyclase (GGDEF)-like protein/PAS domain S-box-containing protein